MRDPLEIACPRCRAPAGQSCTNYRGRKCAPHRDRAKAVNPQAEHRRQAELKTKREHAKALDAAPLFADDVTQGLHTVEENYWRTRFLVAGIQEGVGYDHFCKTMRVLLLKRLARRHLPPEVFTALDENRWKGDEIMYWTSLLTTARPQRLAYERRSLGWRPVTNADGSLLEIKAGPDKGRLLYVEQVELVPVGGWPGPDWVPPYTPEQLRKRLDVPPPQEIDDGGLAEQVRRLTKGA